MEIDYGRIQELISKYEQIKKSGEIKRYNEESTKKDLALSRFEASNRKFQNLLRSNDYVKVRPCNLWYKASHLVMGIPIRLTTLQSQKKTENI